VTLANGKVLITAGIVYQNADDSSARMTDRTAELFDPATRTFTATGGREFAAVDFLSAFRLLRLPNGMVFATFGFGNEASEVYHP
jgi:hypothetical protein